ncbi:hypothetical protein [Bosea sp. 685]|uniref:hypothetical protein n=1 Tax=Bosea sp. 685 TaxID=3080057 RepID=UPI002892CC69|nr:hypothetical protein [Bosea sp. 685]WNJ91306.1 hypothetical protein RMR04_03095 [Bosea sp. 685]
MSEQQDDMAVLELNPPAQEGAQAPSSTGAIALRSPSPTAPEKPSEAGRAMWTVLDHLEQVLDHETSELMALRNADLNRLNETKSRLLLDASRAVRAISNETIDGPLLARLSTLRLKLEHNRLAIAMHLDAVREIAAAMATTLMDADSDGTYSATVSSQLAAPMPAKAPAI